MSKVAVVYWSGTGNTEAMAKAVAEGAKENGAEADVLQASEFGADKLGDYSAVAFGCPAMGSEELEEYDFAPMFEACEAFLLTFLQNVNGEGFDFVLCHLFHLPPAHAPFCPLVFNRLNTRAKKIWSTVVSSASAIFNKESNCGNCHKE